MSRAWSSKDLLPFFIVNRPTYYSLLYLVPLTLSLSKDADPRKGACLCKCFSTSHKEEVQRN